MQSGDQGGDRTAHLDARSLRAFAHPLRVRLYYELGLAGAATATHLAAETGEAVALISYHVHQLAKHGFVVEAPELRRNARERWWRLSPRRLAWTSEDMAADPGGVDLANQVAHAMVREQFRQIMNYLDRQELWGPAWTSASFMQDRPMELAPMELAELGEELVAVVRRYAERAGKRTASGEKRERVVIVLHGFPYGRRRSE